MDLGLTAAHWCGENYSRVKINYHYLSVLTSNLKLINS